MAANQTQIRIAAVDATKQAFQSVQNNIGGLSSSLKRLAGPLTAVFAGFTAVGAIKGTAEFAKEIDRLAKVSGVGVERFQELSYAAERVGISQEKLGDIFKDVNDKVGDFIQTGGGGMADFFENIAPQVGVTADQFRKLNGADALQLYVSSLEKANVSQNDMTFYLEAIASDASYLLPLLQKNGAAMNMLSEEARELGAILNEEAIKESKEFSANLDRMKALFTGVGRVLANMVIPYLNSVVEYFMALNRVVTTEGGFFEAVKKFFGFVGDGAQNRARMFEQFEKNLDGIKRQYQAIADATELVITADGKQLGTKTDLNKVIDEQKEKARQLRDIFAKTRSPVDQLSDALWQAEDALKNLGISEQQYFTLVEQANEAYENSINRTERGKTALQEYAEAAQNIAVSLDSYAVDALKSLEDTMTGLIMGTVKTKDAFKSMATSIIADLTRIMIQRSITGPLAEMLFSSLPGFGGTGGAVPVPGRAIGGPVQSGSPYMVGERGAELFVPNTSGTIVPSNKMGAGGVTINQTLNIDASADRAGIQRALELNRRQTISEINDLMRRNSPALARM